MDKEHVKGTYEDVKGRIKAGAGGLAGDRGLEAEGHADRIEGEVRKSVGDLKEMGSRVASSVQETMRPLTKELENRIARNPTGSVLVAAGLGLLLGVLLGR
jgi:uncharacterized protein YjbJ (UPF0337 family)